MSSASPAKPRSTADVVALARRSLVGVRSASSSGSGTGWVVLGNGLVMTSHEAVGYQTEVSLELENARRVEGRVIWVDVGRDLALVLPSEQLSLPPLFPRPDLPRLGEPAIALSAVPGEPWRVVSAMVSAVDYRIGPLRCFELDASCASNGGPVLDADGRVIGVGGLDLPRGTRRRAGVDAGGSRSLAIPIAALQRALAAVDVPAEQFAERAPTYRCPACGDTFQAREERCLGCGRLLPHAWEIADTGRGAALAGAERVMRDLLNDLGAIATSVRVGPRTYRLAGPGEGGAATAIVLSIDEDGHTIRGKLPLIRIPMANQEPFYRFLLTLNDQMLGTQRFAVEGDTVYLTFTEPAALVRAGEGSIRLQELVREGDKYRKALSEPFEAAPLG
ncbi:Serine protease precursor MucD/AlgY associated with sigma factor RpoE [Minicystis rosea]|nr:Serine protease precursor MucD/AlgY associated with sigma factor RpoE [Minicystis rosea]